MITSKNPVSVSVPREGSARFYTDACCKTEAGVLIMGSNKTHGLSGNRIYVLWLGMRFRCYNKKCVGYKHYGGRGIKVCDEWRNDPKAFVDYMEALPNADVKGMTIDRIDNDGNYEPGNVRWATYKEQSMNRRDTIK